VQARSAPKIAYARIIILLTVLFNTHILIYMHAALQIPHESSWRIEGMLSMWEIICC
jgi:hypothetical protein